MGMPTFSEIESLPNFTTTDRFCLELTHSQFKNEKDFFIRCNAVNLSHAVENGIINADFMERVDGKVSEGFRQLREISELYVEPVHMKVSAFNPAGEEVYVYNSSVKVGTSVPLYPFDASNPRPFILRLYLYVIK